MPWHDRLTKATRRTTVHRKRGAPNLMRPIFVVESDLEISQLLQQHLERVGHAVRTFLNAADVISCAERMCPSLFVVDTVLSDVSGFTLCRNIRKTTSLNRTPIVLLGESASEEDRILGLEWGADDYIGKPFSP